MWYRKIIAQNWQEEYPGLSREIYQDWANLHLLHDRTPEEEQRYIALRQQIDENDRNLAAWQERETPNLIKAEELIRAGKPEQVPQRYFLNHHYTGYISGNPYSQYTDDPNGLDWLKLDRFNEPLKTIERNGQEFELRIEREPARYVKKDKEGEIMRDERGLAIMMTPEEAEAKGYPSSNITVALVKDGKIIGYAGDEFGASGVYVQQPYQGMGLGTTLMYEFLKASGRLQKGSKIGQMTSWGHSMTKNLHKLIVQEALKEGKLVPPTVLTQYPELKSN